MWRSYSKRDGKEERIEWENCNPVLFKTRKEALAHINLEYGYIRSRKDLKAEPYGWKMPRAVKVEVILRRIGE